MWLLRTAFTSQTATVKKLLEDEYEPFAVIALKRNDKPDFKVYFKKCDSVTIAELQEAKPFEFNLEPLATMLTQFFTEFQEMIMRSNTNILNNIEDFLELIKVRGAEKLFEAQEKSFDKVRTVEVSDLAQPTDEELDWHGGKDQPESPDGESFRVVEDIPPELKKARTQAQNEKIEWIKQQHNTNVTIFGLDADGNVKVVVEGFEYLIEPSGHHLVKDTGAGTSSLLVSGRE